MAILKGHQGLVNSISFTPDGLTIATAGVDNTIRFWDLSGRAIFSFGSSHGNINRIRFSNNGKILVSAGRDGTARLWDVSKERLASLQRSHDTSTNSSSIPLLSLSENICHS
jgi:WD40 repeat protein